MAKVITCCGQPLECGGFTNTCPTCGADYNWNGQRLAPRAQWGEETGESLAEILSVDATTAAELLEGLEAPPPEYECQFCDFTGDGPAIMDHRRRSQHLIRLRRRP